MTTHLCPPDGYELTPCCGNAPSDLPNADRITTSTGLVTCNDRATGRQSYADDCTRVYTRSGRVAHLAAPYRSVSGSPVVLCPVSPRWPVVWFGTGNQAEHDRAAALPLCKRCAQCARAVSF